MAYMSGAAAEPSSYYCGQLRRSVSIPGSYSSSTILESPVIAPHSDSSLACLDSDKFLVASSTQGGSPANTAGSHALTSLSSYPFHDGSALISSAWQALDGQIGLAEKLAGTVPSSAGASGDEFLPQSETSIFNDSPSSLQLGPSSSSSELLGSTTIRGDWQQLLTDSSNRFRTSNLSTVSSAQVLNSVDGNFEGLGGGYTSRLGAFDSLTVACRGGAGHSTDTKQLTSLTSCRRWSSLQQLPCGISLEPTKGGHALQGVGPATSHCLDQFSSDPAFAERAANFSPFSTGTAYSQILHPASPLTTSDIGKSRPRVGSGLRTQPQSERNFSRISSCPTAASGAKLKLAAAVSQKLATANETLGTYDEAERGPAQNTDVELGTADQEVKETGASGLKKEVAIDGVITDSDNMQVKSRGRRREHCSCATPAETGCSRESSDDTGNKRKDSNHGKETNIVNLTDSKVDHESDHGSRASKRYKGASKSASLAGATESGEDHQLMKSLKAEGRSSSETSGDSSAPIMMISATAGNLTMKENVKPMTSEPPLASSKQDFVHVRARRGQATDSHSLAERVRREKISERMKYLQELVPGCSKVTGKAVMLDEIINYVQSLRRQVEFLSMKLASANSRLDFNLDSILHKEMLLRSHQNFAVVGPEPKWSYGLHRPSSLIQQHLAATTTTGGGGSDLQSLGTIDALLCRTMSAPLSVPSAVTTNVDAFGSVDDARTQMSIEWDGELQTMIQTSFSQVGRATSILDAGFNNNYSQLPAGHMKVEL